MGFNVDPKFLVQAIKNGQNPQQLMLNILQNNMSSSPMSANLYQLARSGNTAEIEKIVRNIAKSQGVDFDVEFPAFVEKLGLNNGGKKYV
jgi:hypothetical protein